MYAYSFIQMYMLLSRAKIDLKLASIDGEKPKFQCDDTEEQNWIDNNSSLFSQVTKLSELKGKCFNINSIFPLTFFLFSQPQNLTPSAFQTLLERWWTLQKTKCLETWSNLFGPTKVKKKQTSSSLFTEIAFKKSETICAIGQGVAGLCKAFRGLSEWCFEDWNLTAVSATFF